MTLQPADVSRAEAKGLSTEDLPAPDDNQEQAGTPTAIVREFDLAIGSELQTVRRRPLGGLLPSRPSGSPFSVSALLILPISGYWRVAMANDKKQARTILATCNSLLVFWMPAMIYAAVF